MTPFSNNVASNIFQAFPELKAFAREDPGEDGKTYLIVEVPAPIAADTGHGLTIGTLNDEVTVAFDAYHSHYSSWDESVHEQAAALSFVEGILAEEVAVASWWRGDHCGGS